MSKAPTLKKSASVAAAGYSGKSLIAKLG